MIIKIKVIVRDPLNSKKFIGDVLKVNLKKLLKIKSRKTTYQKRTRRKFATLNVLQTKIFTYILKDN